MSDHFELVYGHSGTGKTTWWMPIAEQIYKDTGKKTRLYIGDGGVQTVRDDGLIDDGIVEPFIFTDHPYPFTVCRQMCQGYWPNDKGELAKQTPEQLAAVGMFVFEGLTVVADYILGSTRGGLADRAGRGEKIGQDSPVTVSDPSGEKFGGNAMAHWNFAQQRVRECVMLSKALPGFVQWTAHERSAEFKEENETIVGPDAAGRSLTPKIPSWFGNTIHLTGATKTVKVKDPVTLKDVTIYEVEKRAYLREHGDPDGRVFIKYLANTRSPVVNGKPTLPEYLAPPDALKFYSLMAAARKARRAGRVVA